jgi:16S rRNA (uracil1498-N3)-methyltransferase
VAQPVDSALDRLRRGVIEASKQCGRNRLMEIAHPERASDLFANQFVAHTKLIAHPSGQPLAEIQIQSKSDIIAAIGPEGGFTDAEIAAATSNDWQLVSLGDRILRIETAAIALAASLSLRAYPS